MAGDNSREWNLPTDRTPCDEEYYDNTKLRPGPLHLLIQLKPIWFVKLIHKMFTYNPNKMAYVKMIRMAASL